MEETMAELGMIEKLLTERDRWQDVLDLLEDGNIEKAKEKIRRNIRTIGEALESK